MTSDPSSEELKITANEAERLLRLIDESANQPLRQSLDSATETIQPSLPNQSNGFPSWLMIALAVFCLLAPLAVLLMLQDGSRAPVRDATRPQLLYSATCGSTQSQTGRWWPVLANDGDSDFLDHVRTTYCGDAFFNARGYLQVASFGNQKDAQIFSDRLSVATGRSFRVGEGLVSDP